MDLVASIGDTAARLGQGGAGLGVPLLQDAQTPRGVWVQGAAFRSGQSRWAHASGPGSPTGTRGSCGPVSATCLGNRSFSMKSNELLPSSSSRKVRVCSPTKCESLAPRL